MQSNRSLIDSESNQQSLNNQIVPRPIQTYKAVNNTIDEIIIASKNSIVLQQKEMGNYPETSKNNINNQEGSSPNNQEFKSLVEAAVNYRKPNKKINRIQPALTSDQFIDQQQSQKYSNLALNKQSNNFSLDLTSKLSKKNSLRRNLPSQSRDSQLNSKTHLKNQQDSSHSFRENLDRFDDQSNNFKNISRNQDVLNKSKNCPNCQYINETPQVNINISINIQNNHQEIVEKEIQNIINNQRKDVTNHELSTKVLMGQQILQDEKSDVNEDESRDQVHSIKGSDFGENYEDTNPSRLYCNNHQRQRSHKSDQNLNKFMYNYQENMSTQNVFQSQNTSVNLLLDHSQHNIKNQYQDTLTRQSINGMPAHKARLRSRSFFEESPAKKHWMKISNVLKGINLMRKNIVRTIQHPDELVENINKSPRRRKTLNSLQSLNLTKNVLDEMRLQDKFFELISTGGEHSLQKILKELEDDPKKHIYDLKDPNHLINKYNRVSKTPLYVACQHGNLDVVQLLLEQQADPFILSKAGHKEWESLLQVTARWSHIKVFEYLIQNVKWEKKEILLLLKLQNINPAIKEMAKRYSRYNFGFFFNCCHCI
eukprot:403373739